MDKRWCSACGEAFEPRPQSPRQAYCPKAACQRARKRLWQRIKRSTDDDYRVNQVVAQEGWRRRHPDYWRQYREAHPEYTTSNRQQQKQRNTHRLGRAHQIAKGDMSPLQLPAAGVFLLTQIEPSDKGARRQWLVQLTLIDQS